MPGSLLNATFVFSIYSVETEGTLSTKIIMMQAQFNDV